MALIPIIPALEMLKQVNYCKSQDNLGEEQEIASENKIKNRT